MRDNNSILNSEAEIDKINKEIYDFDLQISNKSFNLRGLLSLSLTRELLLKYIFI